MSGSDKQDWSPERLEKLDKLRAAGLTMSQVAARLGASVNQVEYYSRKLANGGYAPCDARAGDRDVALRCIDLINSYWRERGYEVRAQLPETGLQIVSQTINGLPTDCVRRPMRRAA